MPLPQPLAVRKKRPVAAASGAMAAEQQALTAPTAAAPPQPPKSVPPPQPPKPTQPPAQPAAPSPVAAAPPMPPPPPIPPAVGGAGGAGSASGNAGPSSGGARAQPTDSDSYVAGLDIPGGQQSVGGVDLQSGFGKVDPNGVSGAPGTAPSDFDTTAADFLLEQLQQGGQADTTEEEALIRQQMEDAIGAQLVGSRASMGRAGFGSSGASAALEGDIMRTARQQGLEDTLGLRRTEDQRSIDNARDAIGSDIDLRKQAEDEFFNQEFLNTLKSALAAEPGAAPPPGTVDDPRGLHVPDMNGDGVIDERDKQAYDKAREGDTVDDKGIIHAEKEFDPNNPLTWLNLFG